jgi:hypothetical protein
MRATMQARFWRTVEQRGSDECWLWTGRAAVARGARYGTLVVEGRRRQAHRVAALLAGIIESLDVDLDVHHTCENKLCCNPAHLEPLPHREHMARHRLSECKRGHPFDAANTKITRNGKRRCRACGRDFARAKRRRVLSEP